jgi:hypothetical protein
MVDEWLGTLPPGTDVPPNGSDHIIAAGVPNSRMRRKKSMFSIRSATGARKLSENLVVYIDHTSLDLTNK